MSKLKLVQFGKYLLSEKREKQVKEDTPDWLDFEGRKREVYHADLENFEATQRI